MAIFIINAVLAVAVAVNVQIATGDVNWCAAAFCACALFFPKRTD